MERSIFILRNFMNLPNISLDAAKYNLASVRLKLCDFPVSKVLI